MLSRRGWLWRLRLRLLARLDAAWLLLFGLACWDRVPGWLARGVLLPLMRGLARMACWVGPKERGSR